MESPSVIVFRVKDWPIARPLIEARQVPEVFEELACYLHAPAASARSTLDERLPGDAVEAPLAAMVMELLDMVTEVALDCFGHELFDAGPIGQKHFGFHPSAAYAQVASRFERDGFRVLHAAELVGAGDAPDTTAWEASRARVRSIPKANLAAGELALVEYVRSGGSMPQAGADHAGIALRLGELVTARFEHWNDIDERILDVVCAAGELRGVFKPFAARINAHEESAHDTYGTLRRELARRGIADGRILVALLHSGVEATSSATVHVVSRYRQLDAMIESVRSSEPSRVEQARLITRLLTWMSCVGTLPAALAAVIDLVESPRAKDLASDELRAHLLQVHGYEGPRPKAAKGRGAKHAPPAAPAQLPLKPAPVAPPVAAPPVAAPPAVAPAAEPEAPRKARAKADKGAVPALSTLNETVTLGAVAEVIALGEPGLDAGEDTLLDAVNRKAALAFRNDLGRAVTVRLTGRGLVAQEADHAFGNHHWFGLKTGVDALELRVGDERRSFALPKGKYSVEVVAIRSPKAGAVPDYVLLVRDDAPSKLPKRSALPVIATR